MLHPNSLVIDWSRLVLQQEQHKFRRQFYLERLEYWERFLKSKATGCDSILTVFSSIVLLCVSSWIIIIIKLSLIGRLSMNLAYQRILLTEGMRKPLRRFLEHNSCIVKNMSLSSFMEYRFYSSLWFIIMIMDEFIQNMNLIEGMSWELLLEKYFLKNALRNMQENPLLVYKTVFVFCLKHYLLAW